MKNILPIKEGSNVSIVDLMYYDGYRHQNQYPDDVLYIVYKDEEGNKKIEMKEKPEGEIYFTKPEFRNSWRTPREYIEMDKVYPATVRYKHILGRVYQELKECNDRRSQILKETYVKACETGAHNSKKEILKHQHTFMSDIPIEDYYRIMISNNYNTNIAHKVNKAYLDIETDIYKLSSVETKQNKDTVNAITIIFNEDTVGKSGKRQVYTLLLRDHKRYPQQPYFEEHLQEFIDQCHKEFDEVEIVRKGKKSIIKTNAKYNIKFYDSEGELLEAAFKITNMYKPDTMAIWNIGFDIPKMYNRLIMNGKNPIDVMSDPQFPKAARFVHMHLDDRANVEIMNRKTYIKMTSTVKYLDQMLLYASTRKGMKSYGSNELDNIAYVELGLTKRRFEGKGVTIHNAPIKEYWNFALYSINDVWLQVLIEEVTNDITTIFYDSNSASTAIENIPKQTIYLRNIYYAFRYARGYVSGNNINNDYIRGVVDANADKLREIYEAHKKDDEDEEEDEDNDELSNEIEEEIAKMGKSVFEDSIDAQLILTGGLVGNPNLKSANGEELVKGVKSKHVFQHAMDMDYTAEYPWVKITRSISRSTQYGRLIINEKISERQNEHNAKIYIPGAEFISDYISQDFLSFGNIWFGLKTADEYIKEFMEKIEK